MSEKAARILRPEEPETYIYDPKIAEIVAYSGKEQRDKIAINRAVAKRAIEYIPLTPPNEKAGWKIPYAEGRSATEDEKRHLDNMESKYGRLKPEDLVDTVVAENAKLDAQAEEKEVLTEELLKKLG